MTTTITTFDDKNYPYKEAKEKALELGEACRFKVGAIGTFEDEIVYAYFEVESHNNYAYMFEVRTDKNREAAFVDTPNEDSGEAFDLISSIRDLVDEDPGQIIDNLGIDHELVQVGDQLHYFFDLDTLKEAVNDRCDWLRHDVDSHAGRANFHKVVSSFLNDNAQFIIEDLQSRDKEVTSLDLIDAINFYADGDKYKMLPESHSEIIEGMVENEDRPFGINDDLLDLLQ